jgi:hypothetical protein
MTKDEFIEKVKNAVIPAATTGVLSTIENPPGRKPDKELVQLSEWLISLSGIDKANVTKLVEKAASACLFGVCAVLDGVRVVDQETDCFEIYRVNCEGEKEPLLGETDYHDLT